MGKNINKCHLCDKTFARNSSLQRHITSLHGESVKYKCNFCQKTFKNWYGSLIKHQKDVHMVFQPKVVNIAREYSCSHCDKHFASVSDLKAHVIEIHNAKLPENILQRSKCNICGKMFNSDYLTMHIKQVHEKAGKVKCDICDQILANTATLKLHKKAKHEKSKSFQCKLCDMAFSQPSALSNHKSNIHENMKKFQCTFCGKGFNRKPDLRSHVNFIHEENPELLKMQ